MALISTDWNYFDIPLNIPDIITGFMTVLNYINPVVVIFLGTALAFFVLRGILTLGK